jgi:putative transposase
MKVTLQYRTDLTEKQWSIIKKFIPKQKQGPKQVDRRRILNALCFLVRTGCQWRNLPPTFPKWKTVYNVFLALAQ